MPKLRIVKDAHLEDTWYQCPNCKSEMEIQSHEWKWIDTCPYEEEANLVFAVECPNCTYIIEKE